jgi:ABC-type transport system involved in cytochrome c biogenesis permease subunit
MFFPLHILLMAIATLGIIVGVGAAIFFRNKSSWLKIHKSLNFFSLLGIAAGIIMAVIYVSETSGKHIDGLHQLIGLTAFTFAVVTLFLGFYQFKAKNKLAARTTHRLLGRFSLVLFLTAIMLGLKLINIL